MYMFTVEDDQSQLIAEAFEGGALRLNPHSEHRNRLNSTSIAHPV
jgi:hypothetical protein